MKINNIIFKQNNNEVLYIQIYKAIVLNIINGYLKENDKLPSIRALSKELQVSKTTVENAYGMLLDEGYVISKEKSGYFVNVTVDQPSKKQEGLKKDQENKKSHYLFDFTSKSIDSKTFNIKIWEKYLKLILKQEELISSYGDPQGELQLRTALSSYSFRLRGVLSSNENLIIGAGIQPLLYILMGVFSGEMLTIAIEEDGFRQAQRVFEDCRCHIIKVKVDEDGIDLEDLKKKDFDILYLNTTSSGLHKKRISAQLRFDILKLSKEKAFYIIEDDHNGELYYTSRMIPAIQGFDHDDKVIYLGSFSKLLLPSIRLAYMVLPTPLIDKYFINKNAYNQTASKIEQLALSYYIEDGGLERHLRKLRKYYLDKSSEVIRCVETYFPNHHYQLHETALRIQVYGHFSKSMNEIITMANDKGIKLTNINNKDIFLSFSGIDKQKINEAIKLISDICFL